MRAACLKWLQLAGRTPEEVMESVCKEHYLALLPYKLKWWVTCHQPPTLEEAILLLEAYMSAEVCKFKNFPPAIPFPVVYPTLLRRGEGVAHKRL